LAALGVTEKVVSVIATRCGWKGGSSMLGIALKPCPQTIYVAQHP
jgi:hypothetical protein